MSKVTAFKPFYTLYVAKYSSFRRSGFRFILAFDLLQLGTFHFVSTWQLQKEKTLESDTGESRPDVSGNALSVCLQPI